mmetsp:Transcript_45180/g.141570  ORF Transcript_45180/g.141570 Transcript_45180/m.141570 type:complete len:174 (+) Transcript_45180:247-768(+)
MNVDRKGAIQRIAVAAGAMALAPSSAFAAKYGGFGADSPEVIDPKTAMADKTALESKEVQDSLKKVQAVLDKVKTARAAINADAEADLMPTIRSISYADLRIAMYKASNEVFDEDTQRGTDRLIRVIMQDISEAELAATQKRGVPRTERKLDALRRKMQKLDTGLEDYLKFFA